MDSRKSQAGRVDRERLGAWSLGLVLVVGSLAVGYLGTPFAASPEDIRAVEENPAVEVVAEDGGYVIAPGPSHEAPNPVAEPTGMVFYPGGRVHPNAYLPVLSPVVERTGITVYIPKAPLNLAVFDQDMAGTVVESRPDVERWYVGGHSLGGAMACRFARSNPDQVSGVVLLGSYCDRDLEGTGLRVLSVQGGADTVIDRDTYRRNRENLPRDRTTEVTVSGMNHTQFGAYTGQRGDSPGSISTREAHGELHDILVTFLVDERVEENASVG